MTTWLPTGSRHIAAAQNERSAPERPSLGLVHRVREIMSICAKARAAAHHYEELKPQSDSDLAEKGLKRTDLPRSAFRKLTGQP